MFGKSLFLSGAIFLFGVLAFGSEVGFEARRISYSCGYYSRLVADFRIVYTNEDLPETALVTLRYGKGGMVSELTAEGPKMVRREWVQGGEKPFSRIDGPIWVLDFQTTLAARSASGSFDTLNFFFQIELPDGTLLIDRGSPSGAGYFSAELEPYAPIKCADSQGGEKPFSEIPLKIVESGPTQL